MHLPTYLMLLGAALLAAHLKGVDSFTLDRSSSGGAHRESLESVANARNQTASEDSNEEDVRDSSEEEENDIVKRSAQFSRNSDEFDNVSFELTDRRTLQQNVPSQASQPANIRNFVFRNSNERDDVSDEVRSILARPQITRITPTRTSTLPDRLPVPISFRNQPIRQVDDDDSLEIVRIVSTPSQQIVPVRTTGLPARLPVPMSFRTQILRQTIDFDDDSIEIRSRVAAPIQQTVSTQSATVNRVADPRRTNVFRQSDDRDDISIEVFSFNQNGQIQSAIRPVQQTNNRAQLIQNVRQIDLTATPQLQSPISVVNRAPTTATGINLVFTDSAEQDDFSDEVVRSSLTVFATPITATPPTQTATASSRLPVPMGIRNQNIRPSNANVNRVIITSAPVSRVIPTQTVNQVAPIQTVSQIVPVQTISRIVPTQTVSRVIPIQTVSRVIPIQTVNQIVPTQTASRVIPTQTVNQGIPIQTVNRIVATPTVTRVLPTQRLNLPDRLPVPMGFRNLILRQTIDLDDDSVEIGDRNVFSPVNANNGQVQTLTSVSRPILSQDYDDVSLELELVSTVQNQQTAPAGPVAQSAAVNTVQTTSNQGQQFVQRFDDDSSLENDRDDDIDDDSNFFLEDQMDRADSFRLLATDFFLQPDTNGAPSVRSVNNRKEANDYDTDYSLEIKLSPTHSDETDIQESLIKESDDWFLVKQYMNHDYSSEELEGELAREYFWEPVKHSSKNTAEN